MPKSRREMKISDRQEMDLKFTKNNRIRDPINTEEVQRREHKSKLVFFLSRRLQWDLGGFQVGDTSSQTRSAF